MKFFIFVLILSLLFLGAAPGAALELDVEEELLDFTSRWHLSVPEVELLRDPFADYRPPQPQPGQTAARPIITAEEPEPVSPPQFNLQGVVTRRGDRPVILIQDGAAIIMLRPGEVHDGYEFTHYDGNQAYFFKDNKQFRLSPGGGVDG